jgi:hypothetical protein
MVLMDWNMWHLLKMILKVCCLIVMYMPIFSWIVRQSMSFVNSGWRSMNYADKYLQKADPVFIDCCRNLSASDVWINVYSSAVCDEGVSVKNEGLGDKGVGCRSMKYIVSAPLVVLPCVLYHWWSAVYVTVCTWVLEIYQFFLFISHILECFPVAVLDSELLYIIIYCGRWYHTLKWFGYCAFCTLFLRKRNFS